LPELPEVETIVRGLAASLIGRKILSVEVRLARIVAPEPGLFAKLLTGRTIVSCTRRAKYVVLGLDDGYRLVAHLGMTGRLIFAVRRLAKVLPYLRAEIRFVGGARLAFVDTRTFGRLRVVAPGEAWDAALGVEPLSPAFTLARFTELLAGRMMPIKAFLLDQRHIAGIGNIYACEALWHAKIAPAHRAGAIKPRARAGLHAALREVLQRAVDLRGTTVRDYVDAEGVRGGFQNVLAVYGKHGQACLRCGGGIERVLLAQRGTWWCGGCQR
jgi:formamidopyrimidine-DNA glycosylase